LVFLFSVVTESIVATNLGTNTFSNFENRMIGGDWNADVLIGNAM